MFDTTSLAGFQRDFLQAVIAANPPQHSGLRIHHDTWLFGLIDALAGVYPATHHVLGDEAFKAFSRDYVRNRLLTSGDCTGYGGEFPTFLAQHPRLGDMTWLPDLAAYEYALHQAHHADDAAPCGFEALLEPTARVGLHPSARMLQFAHDIKAAHRAAIAGEPLPRIRRITCDFLVGRDPDNQPIQICLAPLEVEFMRRMVAEASLAAALDQLNPSSDDMTLLQILLAGLVRHGLLITL